MEGEARQQAAIDNTTEKNLMDRVLARSFVNRVSAGMDKKANISQYQNVNWNIFSTLVLNIKRNLPSKCRVCCCVEKTRERMFKRGFDKLLKEISITELIRTVRILRAHTKKNFSQI